MKGILLFVIVLLVSNIVRGQEFSARDFLFASSLSSKKFENYLSKKKFIPCGKRSQNDTVVNIYSLKEARKRKEKKDDSSRIRKSIEASFGKENISFTYFTSLRDEYTSCVTSLKELERRQAKRALVSLCVGGGQGAALWLERP